MSIFLNDLLKYSLTTTRSQVLFRARSVGTGGENPGNEVDGLTGQMCFLATTNADLPRNYLYCTTNL